MTQFVALWGPPGAGKTTLAFTLRAASNKHIEVLPSVPSVLDALGRAPDALILDAITEPAEVKELVTEGLLGAQTGILLRVDATQTDITKWTGMPYDALEWGETRRQGEAHIFAHNVPYGTLFNVDGDLGAPVAELARRCKVRS